MYSIVQKAQADVLTSLNLEEHSFLKVLAKSRLQLLLLPYGKGGAWFLIVLIATVLQLTYNILTIGGARYCIVLIDTMLQLLL